MKSIPEQYNLNIEKKPENFFSGFFAIQYAQKTAPDPGSRRVCGGQKVPRAFNQTGFPTIEPWLENRSARPKVVLPREKPENFFSG